MRIGLGYESCSIAVDRAIHRFWLVLHDQEDGLCCLHITLKDVQRLLGQMARGVEKVGVEKVSVEKVSGTVLALILH